MSGTNKSTTGHLASGARFAAIGFALTRRLERPWLADRFAFPTRKDLDSKLIGGAALYHVIDRRLHKVVVHHIPCSRKQG